MPIQSICEQFFRKAVQHLDTATAAPIAAEAKAPEMLRDALTLTKASGMAPATREQAALAYRAANQKLVGKYPTLDVALKDPDAFVATMTSRFKAHKAADPAHPYAFDFSEYGLPVLKQWRSLLDHETGKLQQQLAKPRLIGLSSAAIAERQGTLAHLSDLKAEIDGHLSAGHIDYQRLQELAYYTSRAMGRFDTREMLSLKERALLSIDRHLQGHAELPIAEERARFAANQLDVFEAPSAVDGFQAAQSPYEKAFKNPNSLDMVVLPTSEALGTDVFHRLGEYNIFVEGIISDPVPADGFVRPASDFMIHDVRHNSAIYRRHADYVAQNHLSTTQVDQLRKQVDVWREQLAAAKKQVRDPELRGAINLVDFNYHHDRGYPALPSSYLSPEMDHPSVPYLLQRMMTLSGQAKSNHADFHAPYKTLAQAYTWLREFWLPRYAQEQAIVTAKPAARAASLATAA